MTFRWTNIVLSSVSIMFNYAHLGCLFPHRVNYCAINMICVLRLWNVLYYRLWECGISDDGCAVLALALRSNPSYLRDLYLFGNKLTDSGVKRLSLLKEDLHYKLENFEWVLNCFMKIFHLFMCCWKCRILNCVEFVELPIK